MFRVNEQRRTNSSVTESKYTLTNRNYDMEKHFNIRCKRAYPYLVIEQRTQQIYCFWNATSGKKVHIHRTTQEIVNQLYFIKIIIFIIY